MKINKFVHQVEMAEAQLNYINGQTDTYLYTVDDRSLRASGVEQLNGRHRPPSDQADEVEVELDVVNKNYLARYRSHLKDVEEKAEAVHARIAAAATSLSAFRSGHVTALDGGSGSGSGVRPSKDGLGDSSGEAIADPNVTAELHRRSLLRRHDGDSVAAAAFADRIGSKRSPSIRSDFTATRLPPVRRNLFGRIETSAAVPGGHHHDHRHQFREGIYDAAPLCCYPPRLDRTGYYRAAKHHQLHRCCFDHRSPFDYDRHCWSSIYDGPRHISGNPSETTSSDRRFRSSCSYLNDSPYAFVDALPRRGGSTSTNVDDFVRLISGFQTSPSPTGDLRRTRHETELRRRLPTHRRKISDVEKRSMKHRSNPVAGGEASSKHV